MITAGTGATAMGASALTSGAAGGADDARRDGAASGVAAMAIGTGAGAGEISTGAGSAVMGT